jgi:hypothetical protein
MAICPNSPLTPPQGCVYTIDKADRRFKLCLWCGETKYRTDEELLAEAKESIEKSKRS